MVSLCLLFGICISISGCSGFARAKRHGSYDAYGFPRFGSSSSGYYRDPRYYGEYYKTSYKYPRPIPYTHPYAYGHDYKKGYYEKSKYDGYGRATSGHGYDYGHSYYHKGSYGYGYKGHLHPYGYYKKE